MKKLLIFKLLALVVFLSSALGASAYTFSSVYNGVTIYYNITSSTNKTVEVTYKEDGYFNYYDGYNGAVTIPSTVYYNGSYYTVTAIGEDAFCDAGGMTSITLPNTITSIGDYAFYSSEMDGDPNQLTTITIPNSVKTIGKYAFGRCYSLQTVVIGDGVTTIGEAAFFRCPNMTDITLGSSVTTIGSGAFDFRGTYEVEGTTYIRSVTFHCKSIIPPTLASNSFPSNSDTFQNPYYMHHIYTVNPYARSLYKAWTYWSNFYCLQNSAYNYEVDHQYDFYTGGIYYLITGTNTVKVCHKYGEGRTSWSGYSGDYSYRGSVTIPTTAYYSGTSKTYNVTAIANNAFDETPTMMINGSQAPSLRNQGDLTSVVVGNNVTTIGENAFKNCNGLTSVTLGTNVSSIGASAFYGCTALATVTCQRSTPATIQSSTFDSNHYSTVTLKVPSTSAVNSYKAATYWKNFYVIVPNGGELNYAANISGGNYIFSTSGTYPWIVKGDGTRVYVQSSNAGVASSTSTMTSGISVSKASVVSFDFKAWGEGSSYDVCIFSVDGVEQFKYGARDNDWESFSVNVPAGSHTLTWTYSKDGSVNPTGDYFAVDNFAITEVTIEPGDVNGDNQVTIADVSALIDILLGNAAETPGADVNGDNQVTIADVSALIDFLLEN